MTITLSRLLAAAAVTVLAVLALGHASHADAARVPKSGPDSADRLIFWVGCTRDVVGMTDAELDAWKSRGVDGFVCLVNHLRGMGGSQDFTGDPKKSLSGDKYELQRALRSSNIAGRAAERGMKMYLGAYLVNFHNPATPLSEWFDDPGWSELVLPRLRGLAGAAKLLGFAGLAFDQELYQQAGGAVSATWEWDYPGNTHSEAAVRAQARLRGRQVMRTIVTAFPGAELMAHDVQLPQSWGEHVHEELYGIRHAIAPRLDIDFLEGLSSIRGYGAIRLIDPTFFKIPHRQTWETALRYHYHRLASLFSRRLSNWEYASSRLFLSPFSWIDEGPSTDGFDDARPPAYVLEQLLTFRKWGMGGVFANFAYGDLDAFDYLPYIGAMQAASTPGPVDLEPPTLEIAPAAAQPRKITGTAQDNLAVWVVRWHDDRGGRGVARIRAQNDPLAASAEYPWQAEWSFRVNELKPRATRVTIVAEDIKGHATTRKLSLDRR